MKRLFLVLLSGVLFSALCAQTNESSPTPLTEKDLRQRAAKTEAIDKLVKAIEANKDTYAQKVQGQIKDSTGEAVGNYELFFNYDKKTQKLLSLLRMERSAEEWYMLQCFLCDCFLCVSKALQQIQSSGVQRLTAAKKCDSYATKEQGIVM